MRWAATVSFAIAVFAQPAPANGQAAKAILVIHTYGQDSAGRTVFDSAFSRVARERFAHVDLYTETLDPNRFGSEPEARRTRTYLRERYANRHIAAVVAVLDGALAFLLDPHDPLFPDVPIAAVLTQRPKSVPDRVSAVWLGPLVTRSLSMALQLHPATRQVVVVNSAPAGAVRDGLHAETRGQVEAVGASVPVTHLPDLTLDELLVRVKTLPPQTLIFFARQLISARGEPMSNSAALAEVTKMANNPIYVSTDALIGTGATGGMVVTIESMAVNVAELARRLVENPSLQLPVVESPLTPMFDWRQLRRFGVAESALPAGSVVRFRQLTFWDQYRIYIIGAITLLVLQMALIAGLVTQRIRRRRMEGALRQSYEQNRDLAGRLIHAQEEERTRIARDLHDDVSQQLAGLSIMMSGLKCKVGRPASQDAIVDEMTTLQDRAAELARSIRNLSHELHPGVLQHAGAVAALRRHCDEVARHHPVQVSFGAGDELGSLEPDVALCLFRVAQEAIANAVRHAQARTIRVQLSRVDKVIELGVADDGIGFVAGERAGAGLGLRSIDERVRLSGGTVALDSRPGAGTSLTVKIPIEIA